MSYPMSRRGLLAQLAAAAGAAVVWRAVHAQAAKISIVVYKSPTCGCCHTWVEHMNASGFVATVKDMSDVNPIKRAHAVTPGLASCHTALVGSYVIEGHVPAADVKRLLAERPKGVVGVTIPGMPQSAPGMDLKPFQPYTVLAFDAQGKTTVFAKHDKG